MTRSLALFGFSVAAHGAPAPSDCGLSEVTVPDFTLIDENTSSATAGQEVERSDFAGQVMLVYFATGT